MRKLLHIFFFEFYSLRLSFFSIFFFSLPNFYFKHFLTVSKKTNKRRNLFQTPSQNSVFNRALLLLLSLFLFFFSYNQHFAAKMSSSDGYSYSQSSGDSSPKTELNNEQIHALLNKLSSDEQKELTEMMRTCTTEVCHIVE